MRVVALSIRMRSTIEARLLSIRADDIATKELQKMQSRRIYQRLYLLFNQIAICIDRRDFDSIARRDQDLCNKTTKILALARFRYRNLLRTIESVYRINSCFDIYLS